MTPPGESLLEAALRLPEPERADLAARLIDSLDPAHDDAAAEPAWGQEILGRLDDLDQGRVSTVPWPEARRRIADDSDAAEAG
jgi:putative addiction module component (TIGR02574 family)